MSAVPYCYTNAGMLTDKNAEYAEKCLAYLPAAEKVYWYDDSDSSTDRQKSLLSYIFSQPALRWAYFLLLISIIVYVFFEGKRRQKIIPIIVPLKNSTVEFAETVGRLYFQAADHKNLAEKKISYFYEFLRNRLYVKNIQPDDKLYFRLSTKTGMKESEIKEMFDFMEAVKASTAISETSLEKLNTLIDNFYKHF